MEAIITKSKKKDKKFDAIIDGKKTISFGAKGYSDFTQHKDPERKQRYLNRHKKNENWNDPKTAGFYATIRFFSAWGAGLSAPIFYLNRCQSRKARICW